MNCEICGTEIKGEPYKTKIENSTMLTCKECSRYGKVQRETKKSTFNNNNAGRIKIKQRNNTKQQPRKRIKEDVPEFELVEDYSSLIKQAREQKNLTQKKLGEKIYERESVVAHIETGKMVPDNRLARKIENALNIKLLEKTETDESTYDNVQRLREATIADIARIKRN